MDPEDQLPEVVANFIEQQTKSRALERHKTLAASFLDGCLHRAGREPFTPFRVSDMAGATTVHKESRTYTGNRLNPVLMHVMASEQESQRPLLTPDEAMRLPEDAALVFASGARPIFAAKLR